jgi:hypothetical protein
MVRYPYVCYFNAFGNHETTRLNTSNKNSQSKHGYSLHVPFTSSFSAALRGLHLRNDQNHWDFISRTKDFIHEIWMEKRRLPSIFSEKFLQYDKDRQIISNQWEFQDPIYGGTGTVPFFRP